LVHKDTGQRYDGDEPYFVVLVDGTQNDSLKAFTPTAVSAAILSRFLSEKESSEVAIETITDAFKLYSDLQFRREADRLEKEIAKLPAGDARKDELGKKRDAALANILEEMLKPSAVGIRST